MAEQYTPEEIQEILQAYNDAVQKNVPISKELAQQMQDAKMGIKNWTNEVNASFKKLGTSATDLGKSLYKGEKGAGQFGGALETATGALETLILLIPGIGIAAKAAAFAIGAFGKAVNVAGKQGEALHKSYKELSQVGAATAGGLQDVFVNAQKLGYGIEDLDKMVALVAANSETLAKFSLSAGDGASAFADTMESLVRDPALRMLGKMPDDINAAGSAYIRQQVMLGRTQRDIGGSLSEQTKKYIVDLDRLQRLTGTSADALQKQQETLMAEDAYNVYMESLEKQGAAGTAQADKIREVTARLPQYANEIAQAIGGNIEAQQKLFLLAPSLISDLRDPLKSTADTIKTFNSQATTAKTAFKDLAAIGGGTRDVIGSISDLNAAIVATSDDPERNAAVKRSIAVTDAGVKNLTQLDLAQMRSREALQSFVQLGVNPATYALSKLAGAAAGVTGVLPGKTTRGAPTSAPTVATPDGTVTPTQQGAGNYTNKVIQAESGGRNIANQSGPGGTATSSAFGIAQITKGTFEGLAKQAGPGNPLYGKTFEDMKADVNLQKQALGQLTDKNRLFLQNAGLSTSDAALYLAHFLGPNGAKRVLSLSNDAPIQQAVDFSQYMANPMLQKMATVGDLKSWADKKMGGVGYQFGGIATGPSSGYQATLHGTEAIVPLPDGKKIPVDMPGFTSSMTDQSSILTQQLSKLDDIVRVMQRQVEVSNKILQMTS